jgi:MFS family permease
MGLYAFFLAGSNYFAPVICGFIAEYQGWRWVFYWPSIFIAFAMVFLFFFMEETNYVREQIVDPTVANVRLGSSHDSSTVEDNEKGIPVSKEPSPTLEVGAVYAKKSYIKKLSLLGPKQEQNTMFRQIWQSLYYLSWPVIFYSGYTLLFYTFMSLQVTNSRQVSHMDPILFYSIF